jgi:hypothetical protein
MDPGQDKLMLPPFIGLAPCTREKILCVEGHKMVSETLREAAAGVNARAGRR